MTLQALMNFLFSPYLGQWMNVYLDDIVINSNTLDEYIQHVRIMLDVMKRERLCLGESKLRTLCKEMKILGRVIDADAEF